MIGPYYLFSYWIFFWYVLYKFKAVRSSPLFLLFFAFMFNVLLIIALTVKGAPVTNVIIVTLITLILKFLPLYDLRNTELQIHKSFYLTVIYVMFMKLNDMDIYEVYRNVFLSFSGNNRNGRSILGVLLSFVFSRKSLDFS